MSSVIAVSQDLAGQRKPVSAFFTKRRQSLTLNPIPMPDNALLAAFGNRFALPTTILYDSEWQRGVARGIGGVEWDDAEMAKLLREPHFRADLLHQYPAGPGPCPFLRTRLGAGSVKGPHHHMAVLGVVANCRFR